MLGGGYNRFTQGGWFSRYRQEAQGIKPEEENDRTTENGPEEGPDSASGGREWIDRRGGAWVAKYGRKIVTWDDAPGEEYFRELFRVSRNQIIWGGNYFRLPPTRCFIVWDKKNVSEDFSMAMCEYAWTSFNDNAKICRFAPQGTAAEKRFHPTQKPIALYSWILNRYAKEGDRILDTHCGSASSLIACRRAGFEYTGFEIDPDYYAKARERLEIEENQINIFDMLGGAEE